MKQRRILLLLAITLSINATSQLYSNKQLDRLYSLRDSLQRQWTAGVIRRYWLLKNMPGLLNTATNWIGVDEKGRWIYADTLNAGAGITTRANALYPGAELGLSLEGQGMKVGIWDASGIRTTHELFEGRAFQRDPMYTNITVNHSTHVAGTIAGSGIPLNGIAKGMAPKVQLEAYDWYNDLSEAAGAAAGGLLLSNHAYSLVPQPIVSWGTYMERTAAWDQLMYAAPYYLAVWAGGNGGPLPERLVNEAANKNGLAVASVYQVNAYTGPSSVILSSFSSPGPTLDGRIKPDICAKGEAVYSSNMHENNSSYNYGWGTSMASAGVTGTLVLLQQYYRQRTGRFMRAATLKALALHTADECGEWPGPDTKFGWGLLNAKTAALLMGDDALHFKIQEQQLRNNDTIRLTVTAAGTAPLKVTVAWTEPPASVIWNYNDRSPRLKNDLDIRISDSDSCWYPWKLDPAQPGGPAITGDNTLDNIERVELPHPVAGKTYLITITHKGQLQWANGDRRQDFSLVLSGDAACQRNRLLSGEWKAAQTVSGNWIQMTASLVCLAAIPMRLEVPATGYIDFSPAGGNSFSCTPVAGMLTAAPGPGCSAQ